MRLARRLMPVFRLLGPDGRMREQGEGDVRTVQGALVLPGRPPLRIPPTDIAALTETTQPYGLRLTLTDGTAVELTMLGRMRGQIFAELRDARADQAVDTQLAEGVGRPETFPCAVGEIAAELRLYDDALVVIGASADVIRVPYPFITHVALEGYRVTVRAGGRGPLVIGRLARRTTEFKDLLDARIEKAAIRTSTFLGALLPGLGALALRATANALRDGLAAPRGALDAIDRTIWPALLKAATLPARHGAVDTLAGMGEMWLGFKQTSSVERPAEGVEAWHDSSRGPNLDHGPGGAAGYGGMFQGMILAGGPSVALWLLGNRGIGGSHAMVPRADVTRGRLTPASTDYDALTVSGEAPPILAFALCRTPTGRLVYEVLNEDDHATYVFQGDPQQVNHALDLIGFQVSAIGESDSAAHPHRRTRALETLRQSFIGRVHHTGPGWPARVAALARPA